MPAYDQWLGEAARHVRMPIPDFGVPTPEQMAQALDMWDRLQSFVHHPYTSRRYTVD